MCASEREYREQLAGGTSSEGEKGAASASLASDFHRQKRGMEEIAGQGEHQGPATRERPLCPSTAKGRVDPAKRSTPQAIEPT